MEFLKMKKAFEDEKAQFLKDKVQYDAKQMVKAN